MKGGSVVLYEGRPFLVTYDPRRGRNLEVISLTLEEGFLSERELPPDKVTDVTEDPQWNQSPVVQNAKHFLNYGLFNKRPDGLEEEQARLLEKAIREAFDMEGMTGGGYVDSNLIHPQCT